MRGDSAFTSDELGNEYNPLPPEPRRAFGSIPVYRDHYPLSAYRVLARGDSIHHVCAVLDITEQTLVSWMRAYPAFEDAMRRGLEVGAARWAKLGQLGMSMGKLFNSNLYMFNMMNRFGWGTRSGGDRPAVVDRLPKPTERMQDIEAKATDQSEADATKAAEKLISAIAARLQHQIVPSEAAVIDVEPPTSDPPPTIQADELPARDARLEVMPDRQLYTGVQRERFDRKVLKHDLPAEVLDIIGHSPQPIRGAPDDEDDDE